MKTYNTIAGLCMILLGSPTIISGQAQKPKLETIAEKIDYIGPDGNYSFKIHPNARNLFRPIHQIIEHGYHDSYPSMPGQTPGLLVIECMEANGNLSELYESYASMYVKKLSNSKGLAPGEKYIQAYTEPKKSILVDNMPAIQGKLKLFVLDANGNEVHNKAKYTILLTLAQDKKNIYGFMNYYLATDGTDIIYKNYNYILKNFKVLK